MTWKHVGFVLRSGKRKGIVKLLAVPRTPSQLSKSLNMNISNVSLKLADLQKEQIVECLNPEQKQGRLYGLTKAGRNVLKHIERAEK